MKQIVIEHLGMNSLLGCWVNNDYPANCDILIREVLPGVSFAEEKFKLLQHLKTKYTYFCVTLWRIDCSLSQGDYLET